MKPLFITLVVTNALWALIMWFTFSSYMDAQGQCDFLEREAAAREKILSNLEAEVADHAKRDAYKLDIVKRRYELVLAGVRKQSAELQAKLDTVTSEECCKRSRSFVGLSEQGAGVVIELAEDLRRQNAALGTCVEAYKGAQIVNNTDR